MDLSTIANLKIAKGAVIGRDCMVVGCTYHCEFEPRSGKVYLIQHYVIKLVSDLRKVSFFSGYACFLHQ